MSLELVSTICAICNTRDNASVLYTANFDVDALNSMVFSARRIPDMIHYQIVRCRECGLVRSDPVVDPGRLKNLYQQSNFTYSNDLPNLTKTYGHYLQKIEKYRISKRRLLEIGCGNGFFLEEALAQGFKEVSGVEPSEDAIRSANSVIRPSIICDMLRPGLFPLGSFSVICMFQTFDHVSEPNTLLAESVKLLEPGGLILCLNHNVDAFSSRILKEKSPIIDIEHTFLYSPKTIKRLFEQHGLRVLEVGFAWNVISLFSFFRLIPLRSSIKQKILDFIDATPLSKLSFTLPIGNLYIMAQKSLPGK